MICLCRRYHLHDNGYELLNDDELVLMPHMISLWMEVEIVLSLGRIIIQRMYEV